MPQLSRAGSSASWSATVTSVVQKSLPAQLSAAFSVISKLPTDRLYEPAEEID